MTIAALAISYPDFQMGDTMNPEEFDTNNGEIVNKINEIKTQVNTNTTDIASINADLPTAVSNAATALATANTADTNADTALADSATAVSTANTAASNASTALATANQTAADFEAIEPTLTQAVIDAEAAVAAVATKASVEYVDGVAANFVLGTVSDGSITDAKLSDAAGAVKDKVNNMESTINAVTDDIIISQVYGVRW